jgi:Ketopantoate hydroxymethyltransferase
MTYLQEASRNAITVPKLQAMRDAGEKIAMLTCYDASFAALLDRAGVDVLLIGDSLGNVLQGQTTTLPVRSPRSRITRQASRGRGPRHWWSPTSRSARTARRRTRSGARWNSCAPARKW